MDDVQEPLLALAAVFRLEHRRNLTRGGANTQRARVGIADASYDSMPRILRAVRARYPDLEIVEDQEGAYPRMVTATGDIDVPPLGRVRVAGKTTAEAEAEIKRRLEADYYYTATVRLALDRVNPVASLRKVQVSGEVRLQGSIEWPSSEQLRLSEAIQRAGGFTDWAVKDNVILYRLRGGRLETTPKRWDADVSEYSVVADEVGQQLVEVPQTVIDRRGGH